MKSTRLCATGAPPYPSNGVGPIRGGLQAGGGRYADLGARLRVTVKVEPCPRTLATASWPHMASVKDLASVGPIPLPWIWPAGTAPPVPAVRRGGLFETLVGGAPEADQAFEMKWRFVDPVCPAGRVCPMGHVGGTFRPDRDHSARYRRSQALFLASASALIMLRSMVRFHLAPQKSATFGSGERLKSAAIVCSEHRRHGMRLPRST